MSEVESTAQSPTCTVCGGHGQRPLYEVRGYHIVACPTCTHAYVAQMPTETELAQLYSDTAESFLGSGLAGPMAKYLGDDDRRYFAFYADRLRAIRATGADQGARILDFGCSQGAFVATLSKRGYRNVVGYDLSEASVRNGRARWNIDLRSGPVVDFLAEYEGTFDVVHAADVLEHVVDPRAVLGDLRRVLRPDGQLVASVPNTRSLQVKLAGTRSPVIDPPHHLQYYGPRSLERLVRSSGFDVTRIVTEFWQPASDLYLHLKGIPLWAGAAVRRMMGLPAIGINALAWGGVIALRARSTRALSHGDRTGSLLVSGVSTADGREHSTGEKA